MIHIVKKYTIRYAISLSIIFIACAASIMYIRHQKALLLPDRIAQDTQIVELSDGAVYDLTAGYVTKIVAGVPQKMFAYNGSIPGPTLHVKQGSTITVHFHNDTDRPAALHSHGLRLDNASDGAPPLTQSEILPGGSFTYTLKFPDPGVYWYHSHVDEVVEQALGLYGAFIVEPQNSKYYSQYTRQDVLMLSDLPVKNGTIAIAADGSDHSLAGHYGNVFLVNGSEQHREVLHVSDITRFYIVNASNARPYRLVVPGAHIKVVGSDNGAYEHAFMTDAIILGPSERAIVDVVFDAPGTYTLQNQTPLHTDILSTITVLPSTLSANTEEFKKLQTNADVIQSIDAIRPLFTSNPSKRLKLTLAGGMGMMSGMNSMGGMGNMMGGEESRDGIEWEDTMGDMMSSTQAPWSIVDMDTGLSNMKIDWNLIKDTPIKIRIYNDPAAMHAMQHPIHFHGQRFVVVSRNGIPETNLVWKDTTLVKAGETVDIILDPTNPGIWMAHCHIAEHLAAGMMFVFTVR